MARKIPKRDFLDQIMKYTIRRRKVIESQKKFAELVKKSLRQYDKRFAVTPMRVRELAARMPEIKIKTQTKRSKKKKKLTVCPVCKKRISKKEELNLLGKKVRIGYRCRRCGFKSDLASLVPRKYTFLYRTKK